MTKRPQMVCSKKNMYFLSVFLNCIKISCLLRSAQIRAFLSDYLYISILMQLTCARYADNRQSSIASKWDTLYTAALNAVTLILTRRNHADYA